MPNARWILCALILGFCFAGCAQRTRPAESTAPSLTPPPPTGKPVIDFSRGAAAIPLAESGSPASIGDLILSVRSALKERLALPYPELVIAAEGGAFPEVQRFQINLSNATLNGDYKPRQLQQPGEVRPLFSARRFEYIADPLHYQNGSSSLLIEAEDARLGLLHDDERNQDSLILTEAARGQLSFSVPIDQLKPMSLAGAKRHSRGGLTVQDLDLKLIASPDGQGISGSLSVRATWLLLPATFLITGQARVDQWNYIALSNLRCTGSDFGGALLSGFIESSMRRHEGKTMPLAVWPGGRMQVTAVDIRTDSQLRLKVDFAAKP